MNFRIFPQLAIGLGASVLAPALCGAAQARTQTEMRAAPAPSLTYADLADLADPAKLIAQVRIRKQAAVEPERSPGLREGYVRLYIVAKVEQVLAGSVASDSLRYLVDVPLGANGRPPRLAGSHVILLGRPVPGRPADVQLVAPDAQLPAGGESETRLVALMQELAAPDRPPAITGIRDILSVPGNLAGESETQLFLQTEDQDVALVSVIRRPGVPPSWGVSWGELVDGDTGPPERDTLAWYRLACFLPARLPAGANLGGEPGSYALAEADYRLVKQELGDCPRNRPPSP